MSSANRINFNRNIFTIMLPFLLDNSYFVFVFVFAVCLPYVHSLQLSNKYYSFLFVIVVVKYFQGTSFMQFATPLQMIGTSTNVEFNIRPLQENGILFYADNEKNSDFIALALNNGYLELR